jgi:hypothetical protein
MPFLPGWLRIGRVALIVMASLAAQCAIAQQPTQAQINAVRQSCRSDYMAHCSSVPPGGEASLACLQQNAAQASPQCQQALRAIGGQGTQGPPAGAAASAPTQPAASARASTPARSSAPAITQAPEDVWPHTISDERGRATVYQPQVISWPDRRTLNTRIAIDLTPSRTGKQSFGTIEVAFATDSDLATRMVTLTSPHLTSSRFPGASPEQAQRFEQAIASSLTAMGPKRVPLDTVLLSLNKEAESPAASPEIKNDPPKIFYSARPASLLVFDGEPIVAPIAGTALSSAVNTNWDVFQDPATKTWYWLNSDAWLTASDYKGPWSPVTTLPTAFSSLPNDNFAAVKKQIPGHRMAPAAMPTIFVSTAPAEIIVTNGTPRLVAIPGTSLKYVSNTDSPLFFHANNHYYYLVSGRWFSAESLEGPWIFATPNLPPDFARIPASSPRGYVLPSVPGTPQANEALLQAQVPTQATLERSTTKVEVIYTGEPKFEPIVQTQLLYAVNTTYDVIRIGEKYYLCYRGVWFVAPAPTGAWILADSVPAVIYTIPPGSPLYRVTFVRVYGDTPTTVTYGYTTGYTMSYVSYGVVVYGTGYYYPPVIWPGPIPIYYPYPYSYSGSTWYNPATGAWARGGTIYGPYGGAVSGGSAYNPNTGAWAHGAAVYGPNGGAGAWSAYNPSTGGYMHGSASWGTDSGTANANWYNGRTGITGSTNQNYNQYGSWGSSTFSGANKTVNTQHQSNAQGTAGSFKSSTGAEGAGVKGAAGNSAGIAKGSGGNVYAGADGNVYKHTSDGWSKWDDGSWQPVQPPTNGKNSAQNRSSQSGQNLSGQTQKTSGSQNLSGQTQKISGGENLSGQTERGGSFRQRLQGQGGGMQGEQGRFEQLDNDRFARTTGAERSARFGAAREGVRRR